LFALLVREQIKRHAPLGKGRQAIRPAPEYIGDGLKWRDDLGAEDGFAFGGIRRGEHPAVGQLGVDKVEFHDFAS
jgi:hypothetical protein